MCPVCCASRRSPRAPAADPGWPCTTRCRAFDIHPIDPTTTAGRVALSSLGAAATDDRRFAYASGEWADEPDAQHPESFLVMQAWPSDSVDGHRQVLAAGDSHGTAELLASGQ